ncbi:MAG: FkbM family methyltransferase [Chitinophagaceae bacterium]|nr:FkbM family methyltransferase [Chitinophagaceae bacterium]
MAHINLIRMRGKHYEITFRQFSQLLPDHGLVLDIGANLGVMSAYLAQKNSSWKIVAIEPIPFHVKVIHRFLRYKRLINIDIVEKAISHKDGWVEMKVPMEEGMLQHGLASVAIQNDRAGELYQVSAITLDQLMDQYPKEVLVGIKIDVENHEWEVLQGGIQTIQKYQPIIMAELWNDFKKQQCLHLLISLGYRVMYINLQGQLVSYQDEDVIDYIFLPTQA